MTVAVTRAPLRWTSGYSNEPIVALLTDHGCCTDVYVNDRLAVLPCHHERVATWVAHHQGERFALMVEAELATPPA